MDAQTYIKSFHLKIWKDAEQILTIFMDTAEPKGELPSYVVHTLLASPCSSRHTSNFSNWFFFS